MPKISKKDLLKLELAEETAAETFRELKARQPVCKECGRAKPLDQMTKKQKEVASELDAARQTLRKARVAYREARENA